jgi:WD40 repeat protein
VACGEDRAVRFWDVMTGKPLGPPLPHTAAGTSVIFSPDARTLLTWGGEPSVRFWPVPAPLEGDPGRLTRALEVRTGLELEASGTVRVLDPPTWQERCRRLQESGGSVLP